MKQKFIFVTVGEALRKGIFEELLNEEENMFFCLRSSLMQLYLNKYVSQESFKAIQNAFSVADTDTVDGREWIVKRLIAIIACDLKGKFDFGDFDSLCKALNTRLHPWVYYGITHLWNMFPNVFYCKSKGLYFIEKMQSSEFLSFYNNKKLENYLALSGENIHHSEKIAYGFSGIFGGNDEEEILYLRLERGLSDIVVEYDLNGSNEEILHGQIIGMLKNKTPVILSDEKKLYLRKNFKNYYLADFNFQGEHIVFNDRIIVAPNTDLHSSFLPYYINEQGEKCELERSKQIDFIVDEFLKTTYDESVAEDAENDQWDVLLGRRKVNNTKIVFEDVRNAFRENEGMYLYETDFDILKAIDIFEKYIDKNEDILELLYILNDYCRREIKSGYSRFMTPRLLQKITEWDNAGKLAEILNDFQTFRDKIMKNIYWTDSKLEYKNTNNSKVGTFEFDENGNLVYDAFSYRDAMRFNAMTIIPSSKVKYKGLVMNGLLYGAYTPTICYDRRLSDEERKKVLEAFDLVGLTDKVVKVIVDKRLGGEVDEKNNTDI